MSATRQPSDLQPDLIPLVDLLARAAYEAICRGDYDQKPDVVEPDKSKTSPAPRPAA